MNEYIYTVSFHNMRSRYVTANTFYLENDCYWFKTGDKIVAMFPSRIVLCIVLGED